MAIAIENRLKMSDGDRLIGTVLAFAYLFFYYVRPQEFIPGLAPLRVSGIVVLMLTIWGALHIRLWMFRTPLALIFFLGVVFGISGLGEQNVSAYRLSVNFLTKFLPQCVALFVLFDSRTRIVKLIDWWCLIYLLMALITIKNGGLGPGDFSLDPNDAALSLEVGLPLVAYAFWLPESSQWQRYLRGITVFVMLAAIIVTGSRGGFLGLIAVFGVFWWFSGRRLNILLWATIASLTFGGLVLSVLPEGYLEEMESISNPEDETRVERLRTWEIAWLMYKDNPVFGVGAGLFQHKVGEYQQRTSWWTGREKSLQGRVTHSVQFQVLSEVGTVGAILYLYAMLFWPLKLYGVRNRLIGEKDRDKATIRLLSQALIASMAAYVVAGAFVSVAYYPHVPLWVAMYAILKRYATETLGERKGSVNLESYA